MKIFTYDAIVVGSGAAGYSAACRLVELGVSTALVTEGKNKGTSRNAGSDKQTYYKLGLGGDDPDSVRKMAQDLFRGGCVDGDNALCEAALSTRCFMSLVEAGVPFPVNRFGEFVGYKTDHDPHARATSAGPLTSRYMTEALEKRADELGVEVFDNCVALKVLKSGESACGLLCRLRGEYCVFRSGNILLATGGPAGIWADSAYPECHTGASSLALLAGAKMQNLALWQYGLASISPRWNVSGTYMQVLPRFVSIDENGKEHDFLWEYFEDKYRGLSLVFLKGYQWPYDPKKSEDGSSLIDLLVRRESCERGRRVFLDFTENPFDIDFSLLSSEAFEYLKKADALFGRPIDRLEKMNAPAIELYRDKGVDLYTEYLEIALCAQHNNGGVAVDAWWQSSVEGLFAVGECAGTHGISRPGGSALNAGQVGALRAAQYISRHPRKPVSKEELLDSVGELPKKSEEDFTERIKKAQRRMSNVACAVQDKKKIKELLKLTLSELCETDMSFRLRDLLVTQAAVLFAMAEEPCPPSRVQEVVMRDKDFYTSEREVRPIPDNSEPFEAVWREFRESGNVW